VQAICLNAHCLVLKLKLSWVKAKFSDSYENKLLNLAVNQNTDGRCIWAYFLHIYTSAVVFHIHALLSSEVYVYETQVDKMLAISLGICDTILQTKG